MQKRVEIENYLEKFSVPIWMMDPKGNASSTTRNGTGVLVGIGGQPFVLTAGHCIELWRGATDHQSVVLCHEPILAQKVTHHEKSNIHDIGFLMLDPTAFLDLEAIGKSFLPLDRVHLERPRNEEDVVISGYPEFQRRSDIYGRHVYVQAACGNSAYKPLREFFCAWVDAENIQRAFNVTDALEADSSSGVSGGGCWVPNFGSNLERWEPELMQVCALHYHAGYGSGVRKMFEMPISNHLQLIAETIPGIEAAILHQWPDFPQR